MLHTYICPYSSSDPQRPGPCAERDTVCTHGATYDNAPRPTRLPSSPCVYPMLEGVEQCTPLINLGQAPGHRHLSLPRLYLCCNSLVIGGAGPFSFDSRGWLGASVRASTWWWSPRTSQSLAAPRKVTEGPGACWFVAYSQAPLCACGTWGAVPELWDPHPPKTLPGRHGKGDSFGQVTSVSSNNHSFIHSSIHHLRLGWVSPVHPPVLTHTHSHTHTHTHTRTHDTSFPSERR